MKIQLFSSPPYASQPGRDASSARAPWPPPCSGVHLRQTCFLSLLHAVEALKIFVWALGRCPSWASSPCLPFPLPLPLSPFLPLPPLVQSPDIIGCTVFISVDLVSVMLRTSSQTGAYVWSRMACITRWFMTWVSLTPLCTSATFNGSASGVPVHTYEEMRPLRNLTATISTVESYVVKRGQYQCERDWLRGEGCRCCLKTHRH